MILLPIGTAMLAQGAAPKVTGTPRVFYINDHGVRGCDPDNEQTLIHWLFHADLFEWEGIVGENGTDCDITGGSSVNTDIVFTVLDAYAADYPKLREHAAFPQPGALRLLVHQGVNHSSPPGGVPVAPSAASRALVQAARRDDPRPLWVVTGGSLSDVSRALHDAPDIAQRIRVYNTGSWNTKRDPHARRRIHDAYATKGLWWIEANTTFRGIYVGGNQTSNWSDTAFVSRYVAPAGALGALYKARKPDMKEGDAAILLYLLNGDAGDPAVAGWGGRYRRLQGGATYWGDLLAEAGKQYPGAETISRWRTAYLGMWRKRLAWAK